MGMKAVHRSGCYFCFFSGPSPRFCSLTVRRRCSWYQICPPKARGSIGRAPLLPRDMTLFPLLPTQRSRETLGPKPQRATGTMEELRGGQGGQDSHCRLCNRGSGQKFPSAPVPKVKLSPEGLTIFMNLYQRMASKKTTGSISSSLGWLHLKGNANSC